MTPAEPAAYDEVAALYDRAFSDIRVRRVEWRWLRARLAALPVRAPRLLELGCGTGAVLRALAPHIAQGVGVDVSAGMLERARVHPAGDARLSFVQVDGSALPFAAASFDVVLSFLSFRYLDWAASFREVQRVLAPGGQLLVIDLVAARAAPREAFGLLRSGLRHVTARARAPRFARDLEALTQHPAWRAMLQRHPMRPLHSYQQFFREQLGEVQIDTLDLTPSRRVVALACEPKR